MGKHEDQELRSEADLLLRQLFELATNRLAMRGITMQFSSSVIEWLLTASDWKTSLNPLRTLDGSWHQEVASRIEDYLLEGSLQKGDALSIDIEKGPSSSPIHFLINSPPTKNCLGNK